MNGDQSERCCPLTWGGEEGFVNRRLHFLTNFINKASLERMGDKKKTND